MAGRRSRRAQYRREEILGCPTLVSKRSLSPSTVSSQQFAVREGDLPRAAMCKSSTLIFVLFFAFLFHLEKYSLRLISVISLISFGVLLMVFNTTSVSIPGILMVFSASGLAGLRWALTELVMHKKSMGLSNPFATIFWLAPLMAVTLASVSIVIEGWVSVFQSEHFAGAKAAMTVVVIVFPGMLAFAMVASEYLCVVLALSQLFR